MKRYKVVLFVCICLLIVGCVKSIGPTGEPTYSVDPNAAVKIQAGLDSGAILASVFWPAAGVFIGWLAGLFRQLNPVLSSAKNKAEIQQTVLEAVTKGVEAISGSTPAVAETIKANVKAFLDANDIAAEGKAIITEAKNA